MIDNTLGSLGSIMGITLVVTMFVKGIVPKLPPRLLALIVGEAATLVFWQAGLVQLEGADPKTAIGWALASIYGLFAVATAMKTHDFGADPRTAVRPMRRTLTRQ